MQLMTLESPSVVAGEEYKELEEQVGVLGGGEGSYVHFSFSPVPHPHVLLPPPPPTAMSPSTGKSLQR